MTKLPPRRRFAFATPTGQLSELLLRRPLDSADRLARHALALLIGNMTPVTAYAALAEPHRREILDLLLERERSVGALVASLDLSQPGVSKHLKVLREAGLVAVRAEGKQRVYTLRARPLAEVDAWLAPYRAFWSNRLDALERHLEENPE